MTDIEPSEMAATNREDNIILEGRAKKGKAREE